MKHRLAAMAAAAAIAGATASYPAISETRSYQVDRSHATVSFTISHLGFSQTMGWFREFTADIQFDPDDPASPDSRVEFVIDAASVDTGWGPRDDHIRRSDFLDVSNHPEIRFVSTAIEPLGEDDQGRPTVRLTGDLTIIGNTNPVTFDVVMNRRGEMRGREVIGFTATSVIDRTEFGVDRGAPAIGAEMQIWVSLEIRPS